MESYRVYFYHPESEARWAMDVTAPSFSKAVEVCFAQNGAEEGVEVVDVRKIVPFRGGKKNSKNSV